MKAYPEYKESGFDWIGKYPSHWTFCSLGYKSRMIVPMRDKPQEFDGDIPWIRIEDFNGKYISGSKSDQKVSETTVADMNLKVFPVGTVLCSCSCSMGATAIVSQPLISNQTFIGIVPTEDLFSDYLYYLVQAAKPTLDSLGTGAIQKYLSRNDFEHFKVAFPSFSEQQAIADFLDRKTAQIDALIEKKQRQIDLLQEQRTALINHAVTKGLNPDVRMKDSGVEWLGEIPSHWEMTTVRYFYDVKLGKMLDSNKQNGNDLVKPYLRAANIHWNEILLDEVGVNEMEFSESQLERYALQSGDLLVTEGGVTVGRSAIWNGELTECYFQNSLNRARPSKHASTKWLYYWMYFVTNNGFIDILADKSTFGHLTNEKLKALPVPIPPISEHDEIIEKLESYEPKMEAQIILIEKQIAYLQEYRTALISEAVTGKIDVRTS
jgi:type I restriction enzyme S subunit